MSEIKRSTMLAILDECYNKMAWMKKKYPKAARKRRVVKKWRNRFGLDLNEIMLESIKTPLEKTWLKTTIEDQKKSSSAYGPYSFHSGIVELKEE